MKIYACGGAGINLARQFESYRGKKEDGFSPLDIVYLDTSESNLRRVQTSEDNIYVVEDEHGEKKSGGGKKRKLNYSDISNRSHEILQRFKPDQFNIVIHSFSGGSGSVIGPVLVSNLLEKGLPVVVIGVGSIDSRIEIDNTQDTIKSYTNISAKRNKVVPCIYYENNKGHPRGETDLKIQQNIAMLSVFFSGENHELDYTDMYNFLNYQEVTDYAPKLSYLEFHTGEIELVKDANLISVATLSDEHTGTSCGHPVEYQCTGFISNEVKEKIGVDMPIHLCVIDGVFTDIMHGMTKLTKEIKEHRNATIKKDIEVNLDNATDEGLVI